MVFFPGWINSTIRDHGKTDCMDIGGHGKVVVFNYCQFYGLVFWQHRANTLLYVTLSPSANGDGNGNSDDDGDGDDVEVYLPSQNRLAN